MAYENGTASSANDLLDKLRLFAIAQGWSVNRWTAVTAGYELALQKGSAYYNFRSWENGSMLVNGTTTANKYGITMNGSDGYSGAAQWDRQSGYPLRQSSTGGDQGHALLPLVVAQTNFPNYYLFTPNANCIYLELEVASGIFHRLGFGSLDLFNPAASGEGRFFYATGGEHVTNSTSSSVWLGEHIDSSSSLEEVPFRAADVLSSSGKSGSFVRCAFDAFNNWAGSAYSANVSHMFQACQGGGVHDKILRESSPNPRNGIGLLTPNVVSVNRTNTYLAPLGVVPGIRYMDMTNYLPGAEFTIGADTWKVFPWYQKGGRSYNRGIAYRKIV